MDPFASTADAATYLPREATERALARLAEGLRRGRRVQVLSGPPGLGKTLLLRVLAARLGNEFNSLYLPYASLGWPDLCTWILGLLEEPPGAFPDRELLASARRSALRGRPLLLLVDEASGIPLESAQRLGELVEEAEGALRLLLVPADDPRAGRVLAVLARDVEELRLSAPLTLEETELYVRTRLVRSATPTDVLSRFDADTVTHLHRASGGNPQRLHHLAGEVMRGNAAALPGSAARAELGAVPGESDNLEVDGAAGEVASFEADAFEEAELPALRGAGGSAASGRVAPRPVAAPASPALSRMSGVAPASSAAQRAAASARAAATTPSAAASYEPPLGPREPERTNWWFVVAVNLVMFAGMAAGLWFSGLFPPPSHP